MTENGVPDLNRRGFLQTGAATAAALGLATTTTDLAAAPAAFVLPKRPLGKTGVP